MKRLLCGALGAGLLAIGAGAIVAPAASSAQFGLATREPTALAFVRATGARDMILGALVLAALDDAAALRRTLGIGSLLGLADAATLAWARGLRPQHAVHLVGFVALLAAAVATRK